MSEQPLTIEGFLGITNTYFLGGRGSETCVRYREHLLVSQIRRKKEEKRELGGEKNKKGKRQKKDHWPFCALCGTRTRVVTVTEKRLTSKLLVSTGHTQFLCAGDGEAATCVGYRNHLLGR